MSDTSKPDMPDTPANQAEQPEAVSAEQRREEKKREKQRIAEALAKNKAEKEAEKEAEKDKREKDKREDAPAIPPWWQDWQGSGKSAWQAFSEWLGKLPTSLRASLWRNGWIKLACLIAAGVIWFLINTDPNDTSYSTFSVTPQVLGLNDGRVSRDIPEVVEVTLVGASDRIDTLRPEQLQALIDLRGIEGDFKVQVEVPTPQATRLINHSPREIIGRVEAVYQQEVPVQALALAQQVGSQLEARAQPAVVVASGYRDALDAISRVVALYDGNALVGDLAEKPVRLQAIDSQGMPVEGVRLEPNQVTLNLERLETMITKRVPVHLELRNLANTLSVAYRHLNATDVLLGTRSQAGKDALAQLSEIRLPFDASGYEAGLYSIGISLPLPEGVQLLGRNLTLDLELVTLPEPTADDNQDKDDASPVRQQTPAN